MISTFKKGTRSDILVISLCAIVEGLYTTQLECRRKHQERLPENAEIVYVQLEASPKVSVVHVKNNKDVYVLFSSPRSYIPWICSKRMRTEQRSMQQSARYSASRGVDADQIAVSELMGV